MHCGTLIQPVPTLCADSHSYVATLPWQWAVNARMELFPTIRHIGMEWCVFILRSSLEVMHICQGSGMPRFIYRKNGAGRVSSPARSQADLVSHRKAYVNRGCTLLKLRFQVVLKHSWVFNIAPIWGLGDLK